VLKFNEVKLMNICFEFSFSVKKTITGKRFSQTTGHLSSQNKSGPAKQQAPDFPLFPAV
jgi:hypothetical protein